MARPGPSEGGRSAEAARAPRLYVVGEAPLAAGARLTLDAAQSHYLGSVLRLRAEAPVLVFDGRAGEWLAHVAESTKRGVRLLVDTQRRPQTPPPDLRYLFAPLKHARLDYMVQKAVEMGAGALWPVLTRRTVTSRLNRERMAANAVEAAEQCHLLSLPTIEPERPLDAALDALPPDAPLVFCDEAAPIADPLAALAALRGAPAPAVLVGPEGGFAPEERERLLARPGTLPVSLGPRVLRADTAAVAALALVQAARGEWESRRA